MARKFVRSPQGVTHSNNGDEEDSASFAGQQQFSAYLSSVYEEAQAATGTRSVNVVTSTTMEDESTTTASPDGGTTETTDPDGTDSMGSATAEPSSSSPRYTGTTLATQTSQQTSSGAYSDTPLLHQSGSGDDGGLSRGQLAAAITVPIIFTAFFALLVFLTLRRRRKSPSQSGPRPESRNAGLFGLREKWGTLKSSASSQNELSPQVTLAHNNTYMTGLDTPSRSGSISSPQSGEQPPPYLTADVPRVLAHHRTSFSRPRPSHDPPGPVSHEFLTPNPSFLRRPGSSRSINSDAYSDTASIHSARAARMSVGTIIAPYFNASHDPNKSSSESVGDPFETPTPSVMLGRRRQGSGESKDSETSARQSEEGEQKLNVR